MTICSPRRALMLRRLLRALRTRKIGKTLEMLRNVKPVVKVLCERENEVVIDNLETPEKRDFRVSLWF